MELSAFAHMTKRNVKVIQPGLVYVIEWAAGGDMSEYLAQTEETAVGDRETRRSRREKRRETEETELSTATGTAYVAYVSSFSAVSQWLTVVQLPRLGALLVHPKPAGSTCRVSQRRGSTGPRHASSALTSLEEARVEGEGQVHEGAKEAAVECCSSRYRSRGFRPPYSLPDPLARIYISIPSPINGAFISSVCLPIGGGPGASRLPFPQAHLR